MSKIIIVEYRDVITNKKIALDTIYTKIGMGFYKYYAKVIEGYDNVGQTSKILFITLFKDEYSIVFLYEKKEVIKPIIKGSILIAYIDSKLGILSEDKHLGLDLSDYTYEAKTIEGYNLIGDSSKSITITESEPNISIVFNYKKEVSIDSYLVELIRFGISNNGKYPVETSKGINDVMKYTKEKGYKKVIMPMGDYCISEKNPIIMMDNITLDLNGSTFRINTNGLMSYSVINFTGCTNANLVNGTILGDRYDHDYNTIKGSHEWGCGIGFNDCDNCSVDSINVKSVTGYGITSSLGKNLSSLVIGVTLDNLKVGNISQTGELNNTFGTIRTIKAINISKVGGAFELGYNKGYMGYKFMSAKIYDSYFYDADMKLISISKSCKQYKKVIIPSGGVFVNFVFYQNTVPTKGDTDFLNTTVFITNYNSPYKIIMTNCVIEDNRSLGIGICGGRNFLIENNIFKNNKGIAPGYAINIEDGWEYMDQYLIKNNKFMDNANDIVSCAGDNIIFENNDFTSTVYMWGRTTNYKFINNKFANINQSINYEYSTDTLCSGNIYNNSNIVISRKDNQGNFNINNENLINSNINSMSSGVEIIDSIILSNKNKTRPTRLAGLYRQCTIECDSGDLISAEINDCKVNNTNLNYQGIYLIKNSTIQNSIFSSTSNSKSITVENCNSIDSKIYISTWGSIINIKVENSEINMTTGNSSFIDISAGKSNSIIFKKNIINNKIAKSIFNMFDTSYTIANGNITIDGNTFNQINYKYVFDGVNISNGIFNLRDINNIITGATMINPKYINNKYFNIIK